MIGLIDRYIEKELKKYLYKQREYHFQQALEKYEKQNPGEDLTPVKKKLETELTRIYPMVDQSILAERVKRAKYTFWGTIICCLVVVGAVVASTSGLGILLVAPVLASISAWALSLATIPISYNHRVIGAYDSVLALHKKESLEKKLQIKESKEAAQNLGLSANDNSKTKLAEIIASAPNVVPLNTQNPVREVLGKYTLARENEIVAQKRQRQIA